jgi:hypothetical protein
MFNAYRCARTSKVVIHLHQFQQAAFINVCSTVDPQTQGTFEVGGYDEFVDCS